LGHVAVAELGDRPDDFTLAVGQDVWRSRRRADPIDWLTAVGEFGSVPVVRNRRSNSP
jgi:hypothetical protein